mmetsp:Transcript_32093/g.48812  ORF Transcript_32093/g.48812 Transcript_32093/m.48812 type:complete len:305 (-) Transcript_32093:282-1196(-)
MIFRSIYVPFLLLLAVETCGGAWFPRSARTSFLLSPIEENLTKVRKTVIQQDEASKCEVRRKMNQLSKESEFLANEKPIRTEQEAIAGTRASEQISRTEQAVLNTVLDRLAALEEAAKGGGRRQATLLEMEARANLSALRQAVEKIIHNFFGRLLPSEVPEIHRVQFLSEKNSERLLTALITLVLVSAFGNLSGQIKAWDIWEAADGAFGDHYFPFSVDFVAKRILAGILDFVALVLITIPNPAKDITASLGSAMVTLMFGRAALIHEGGFMFVFSSVTAITAATLMLNNLFLVPAKEQPKRRA